MKRRDKTDSASNPWNKKGQESTSNSSTWRIRTMLSPQRRQQGPGQRWSQPQGHIWAPLSLSWLDKTSLIQCCQQKGKQRRNYTKIMQEKILPLVKAFTVFSGRKILLLVLDHKYNQMLSERHSFQTACKHTSLNYTPCGEMYGLTCSQYFSERFLLLFLLSLWIQLFNQCLRV